MKSSFFTFFLLLPLSLFSQEKCSRLTSWEKEILKHRKNHPLPRSIPEAVTVSENITRADKDNDSVYSNEESVHSFENISANNHYAGAHHLSLLNQKNIPKRYPSLFKNKSTHNLFAAASKEDITEIRTRQAAYDAAHPDTPSESPTPVSQNQNIDDQDDDIRSESLIRNLPLPAYEQSNKSKNLTQKSKRCCIL